MKYKYSVCVSLSLYICIVYFTLTSARLVTLKLRQSRYQRIQAHIDENMVSLIKNVRIPILITLRLTNVLFLLNDKILTLHVFLLKKNALNN